MGLLDDIFGDAVTKDEYGQTEAERRQPIWSGLLGAGMQLMAGGQQMRPRERAQYLAQAGGALAGIPGEMNQQRSQAQQGQLRQMQLAQAKQKISGQTELARIAASDEFKNADPQTQRKMLMQAALQSGDVDAAQRLMSSADQHELGVVRNELALQKLQLAKAQGNDLYEGKGDKASAGNFVNKANEMADKGDLSLVNSLKYFDAYNLLTTDQYVLNPITQMRDKLPGRDISGHARPPGYERPRQPGEPDPGQPRPVTTPPGQVQRRLDDKALTGITNNLNQLNSIDEVLSFLEKHPDAIGTPAAQILDRLPGRLGQQLMDARDPTGVPARTLLGMIAGLKIHDISGANVTAAEEPRLVKWIPLATDQPEVARIKLGNFRREYDLLLKMQHDNIKGVFQVPEELTKRYGAPAAKVPKFNPTTGKFE